MKYFSEYLYYLNFKEEVQLNYLIYFVILFVREKIIEESDYFLTVKFDFVED